MSDNMEDELLSVVLVKNNEKAVVGTQEGVLDIWSWGDWGDLSDRFPGHPYSIDTIAKVDENTIVTGSSDGIIRVCGILPNKLLGVIGEHGNFPIERIRLSPDNKHLGSCSHDNTVKFWHLDVLFESTNEQNENITNTTTKDSMQTEATIPQRQSKSNFYDGLL